MEKDRFALAVKSVFNACRRLSKISGEIRKFTPDGRMVGDIGEVIAEIFYQVKLHNVSRHDWDGTYNGRNVQIKTTQHDETYLKEPPKDGFGKGLLMVFKINSEDGSHKLVYNGEIQPVWDFLMDKRANRSGEKSISLKNLEKLQDLDSTQNAVPAALK